MVALWLLKIPFWIFACLTSVFVHYCPLLCPVLCSQPQSSPAPRVRPVISSLASLLHVFPSQLKPLTLHCGLASSLYLTGRGGKESWSSRELHRTGSLSGNSHTCHRSCALLKSVRQRCLCSAGTLQEELQQQLEQQW